MKYEYIYDDGDVFIDYSWERAFSIYGDVYPEWCLEFFSMMYFDRGVDRSRLFAIHFTRLEVDDKLFNHEAFWQKIRRPTSTNLRISLMKEPLMSIVHKLLVGSLVHRAGSKERSILHHLADQSNFAYPIYETPNVPPYPYPYVPFPYPYTHYPNTGSPSFGRDHYGAHGDSYHAGSIVPNSGYEIEGSSAGFHGDDFDLIVHLEDCVQRNGDEMRD
nr:hypothetical protein [Tanacetum cinerariifolium]